MKVTPKMSVHFDVPYGAREQDVYLPPRPTRAVASAQPGEFSQTLGEYMQWAHYLDELVQRARQGQDDEARELARGKLRFLRRRVEMLREDALLSAAVRERLPVVHALYQLTVELSQVVMELTGRVAAVADEWPLPYRLYSRGRQPVTDAVPMAAPSDELLPAPRMERRAVVRKEGNRLAEEERQDVRYTIAGIRFIQALAQGWHGMEQSAGIGGIEQSLQQTERLAA